MVLARVAAAAEAPTPSLDAGFARMYNLDFAGAQAEFEAWQKLHPQDPVGPVAEAAGLLFSELDRLQVLEAELFVENKKFLERKKLKPDAALKQRFEQALARAERIATERLAVRADDADALFATTLVHGLRADYASLVEKRNMAALGYTKDATEWARKLLAVDPERYDAYLATGLGNYLIGSLAAPVRWFLRLGGYSGDKQKGIQELTLCAERGHYLKPFARLLLAVAYLREKDKPRARELLAGLRDQFPANPLFAREIARIDAGGQ